jgi:hypothetical protein
MPPVEPYRPAGQGVQVPAIGSMTHGVHAVRLRRSKQVTPQGLGALSAIRGVQKVTRIRNTIREAQQKSSASLHGLPRAAFIPHPLPTPHPLPPSSPPSVPVPLTCPYCTKRAGRTLDRGGIGGSGGAGVPRGAHTRARTPHGCTRQAPRPGEARAAQGRGKPRGHCPQGDRVEPKGQRI